MVQDRKEPTFSGIKPERDEIANHQTRVSARRETPPPSRGASPRASSKASPLAAIALLFGLVAAAVAGFGIWQLQEAQKQLVSSEARIAELEARLNLTNSESSESVTAILEKLKWADSEIRKLWGVSNDTNRKAIQANKENIAALDKVAKQAAADAKTAKQASDGLQTTLSSIKNLSSEQQLVLTKLSDDIDMAQEQVKKLQDTYSQVDTLAKRLDSRMSTTEDAIKAIDAFRRSANADIQSLKQQSSTGP